ncbi:hypothetical protein NAEGRDRAFT_79767 [Naegleria gruberi]|uniref:Uncharacterized protein AM41 n=1 Tax=Naegleria gruberi TaxID=5762 RepID=D2VFH8_NAEGR|nr:uncharacterized protein NAEGRDRAFT_79767 [Naegleria gruberi]EFC44366.1 hypothetical protein NAEGRDRAFT_79767 [Naegleria gruberi]|eukprot:XP_002677110.1 hypothetical protein NAEGRDRAFT_79767 [Naegleria gruberi strain NEG-M]
MPKEPSHSLVVSDAKLNELLNDTVFVGSDREAQKNRIKNGDFNYFKVDQLKAMIKFLRTECNRYDLSLQGKKANLVDKLKDAFFNSSPSGGSGSSGSGSSSGSSKQTAKRTSFTTISNAIKLQSATDEEQRLLREFNLDKTLKGRIDPHQQVEQYLYVKVFHQGLASFSFDLDLSEEEFQKLTSQNYQINIHYFTHDMVPRNWNNEHPIFFNGHKLDNPALNRKIAKGMKKEVLIVSTPFVIKGEYAKVGVNRVDIKAGPYSTMDGRLVVNFLKMQKSEELVQSIVSKSTVKHNLDLDNEKVLDILLENKIKYVPVTSTNESIITFDDTSSKTITPITEQEKKSIETLLKIVGTETPISKHDDMIDELEGCDEIVPLKDPLSLCRIELPAKGKFCVHKSCFDLVGYLDFGASSKTYNCPRCDKPLPFDQLIIDPLMQKILSSVSQDVDKVLVRHDGSFTVCDDAPKKKIATPAKPPIIADIIDDDDEDDVIPHSASPPFMISTPPPPNSILATNTASTPQTLYPPVSLADLSRFFSPSLTPTSNSRPSLTPSTPTLQKGTPTTTSNPSSNTNVNSYGLSVDDAIEID